jgi:hypothetical protein
VGLCDRGRRKPREKMLRQARIAVGEDSDRPAVRSAADAFSIESVSGMRRNFLFRRTLSIARHRLVDLASPGIDAAVEADCVVKAGASEEVDHHLTASAMMANDHQQLISRKVVGLRRNLRHWNIQSTFQSANITLSRLPDIENRVLCPCAPHVRKLANRDPI